MFGGESDLVSAAETKPWPNMVRSFIYKASETALLSPFRHVCGNRLMGRVLCAFMLRELFRMKATCRCVCVHSLTSNLKQISPPSKLQIPLQTALYPLL